MSTAVVAHVMARATASACRWPPDRLRTGTRNDRRSMPRCDRATRVSPRICSRSTMPRRPREPGACGFTPEEQVVGDGQVGRQRQILVHGLDTELQGMPDGLDLDGFAPVGDLALIRLERRRTGSWPASDFPAPLSPTRASTSPGRSARSAPRSAWRCPYDLVMPVARIARHAGVANLRRQVGDQSRSPLV